LETVAKTVSGELLMAFSSLIFARSNAIAFYAGTRVVVDESVLGRIFMPFRAMSYSSPDYIPRLYGGGVSFPAPQILLQGNRFEVRRIDAAADSAQMVNLQSFRDRTDQQFVAESVGFESAGTQVLSIEESSVAADVESARPEPASGGRFRRYALPELLFSVTLGSSHSILLKSFWSGLHDVISVVAARFYCTPILEGAF
jgi:hypothetical protein